MIEFDQQKYLEVTQKKFGEVQTDLPDLMKKNSKSGS